MIPIINDKINELEKEIEVKLNKIFDKLNKIEKSEKNVDKFTNEIK